MRYAIEPCPEEQAFRFSNGARARSLEEFRQTILQAPPDVLQYHRAHFHYWIKDILQDAPLAERVRQESERAKDAEHLRGSLDGVLERSLQQVRPAMPTPAQGLSAGRSSSSRRP